MTRVRISWTLISDLSIGFNVIYSLIDTDGESIFLKG